MYYLMKVENSDGELDELKLHVKMLARLCVFSFIISFCAPCFNWSVREYISERVMDGVQIATTKCIGVFVLVKLTSEDNNAIRNTLLGIRILSKPEQFVFYLGFSTESEQKHF